MRHAGWMIDGGDLDDEDLANLQFHLPAEAGCAHAQSVVKKLGGDLSCFVGEAVGDYSGDVLGVPSDDVDADQERRGPPTGKVGGLDGDENGPYMNQKKAH